MESATAARVLSAASAPRPWQRCFWNSSWFRSSTSSPTAASPASAIRQEVAGSFRSPAAREPQSAATAVSGLAG